MDRPSHAPLYRLERDVREPDSAQALHDWLLHQSSGREPNPARAGDFVHVFTEAWAQEMDWRIARGGVTTEEIERIAALAGQEPPDEDQVELIRALWSSAIGDFIEEEVTEVWLADSGLSAIEWERVRPRITVVHDHGEPDDRIDELAWRKVEGDVDMDDDEAVNRAHDAALSEIRAHFEGRTNREGFRAAQVSLPEKHRYERLGGVEDPWPADVWAMPDDEAD